MYVSFHLFICVVVKMKQKDLLSVQVDELKWVLGQTHWSNRASVKLRPLCRRM